MEENTKAGSAAQVRRLLLRRGRGDAKELEGPAQFQVLNVQRGVHDTRRMLHVTGGASAREGIVAPLLEVDRPTFFK